MSDFMTVQEASLLWNIGVRRIQVLCKDGRIDNLTRVGRSWLIPRDAKKPDDARITSGKWVNYRNRTNGGM